MLPSGLKAACAGLLVALALLTPATGASAAWTREAAPQLDPLVIQPGSSLTVLPDGSGRYLALGATAGGTHTNQLVVRPPAGPAAFASPFPAAFGQYSSYDFVSLSPADAAGDQLAVRGASPFGVAFLAPGANPAAATVEPTRQITQIDLAPSGEAVAIMSDDSKAYVSFRAAGPAGRFDAPRELGRAGNMRSYGVAITLDPDGGVFVLYRTEQNVALLQTYAPPGGSFGAPQLLDVPAASIGDVRYGQSTNGRGILAWSEDTVGDSTPDKVWVASRQSGGLLTGRSLVAEAAPGRLTNAILAAVTDDGAEWVAYLDANPVSGCPGNADLDGGSVLAVRSGGDWTKLNTPTAWPEREDVNALSTAGNAVGVVSVHTTDNGARCDATDPTSRIDVRLGQGAALGATTTLTSESITSYRYGTVVRPQGFAVNASGAALLLASEPYDAANNSARYLYYQGAAGGGGGDRRTDRPLPAPGRVVITGGKLVARGGEAPFQASCTRLPGEGSRLFCSISAILIEQAKHGTGRASAHAAAKGSGRRGARRRAAKPQTLGSARAVRVPVGTTRTLTIKLNGVGASRLKATGRRGLTVVLRVTIRRSGYAPRTIERKVKLVAGRARRGGRRGAGRRPARR